MTIELRQKRAKLLSDMRGMVDQADREERKFTADEEQTYSKIEADVDELEDRIERSEKLADRERSLGQVVSQRADISTPEKAATSDKMSTFRSWLRDGVTPFNVNEVRDLAAGAQATGGALVAPEEFVARLIKEVDDQVVVRQFATKLTLTQAASLGVPSLDADPADADWTTEILTGTADTTMSFGKRVLSPSPLAKKIKLSQTLIRQSAINAEDLVLQRMGYKFAVTEEKGFLTGDGNNKPLGLFTASANGISTDRDVSTDNTTTAVTFDGLMNAQEAVDSQYWPNAKWLISPTLRKALRKIKDGNGQYVFVADVQAGAPNTLLGNPVLVSKYVPAVFTTGLYVALFGDLSYYWIADSLSMQVQRLVELYAEANQIGYIGRLECDGMPVLQSAFARVKLA